MNALATIRHVVHHNTQSCTTVECAWSILTPTMAVSEMENESQYQLTKRTIE
jgi:hypothetical protein